MYPSMYQDFDVTGLILGAAGGAVAVLVILVILLVCSCRRKITKKGGGNASPPPVTETPTRPNVEMTAQPVIQTPEAVHVQIAQPAFVAPPVEPIIAAAVVPAVPGKPNKAASLRELKALLDQGVLSQDEFDAEKKNILSFDA